MSEDDRYYELIPEESYKMLYDIGQGMLDALEIMQSTPVEEMEEIHVTDEMLAEMRQFLVPEDLMKREDYCHCKHAIMTQAFRTYPCKNCGKNHTVAQGSGVYCIECATDLGVCHRCGRPPVDEQG